MIGIIEEIYQLTFSMPCCTSKAKYEQYRKSSHFLHRVYALSKMCE